jgi:sigma-B regulation protein RsbU (phosphoserine phosphatase)
MANPNTRSDNEPKIRHVLRDDLSRGDFWSTLRRDFRELKEFMLTDERRKRLNEMSRVKQWLSIAWWLLKGLILKLTPARRLLLLLGVFLVVIHANNQGESQQYHILGGLILLFVLMLELKDKLIAREELEAGHVVQKALMPERTPFVPGWKLWLFTRSANEVGGDLVDFMQLNENRFAVAVGDVAGKGLRAALLMAKLQATLRALAPDFSSLGELAAKLNQIFCRDSLPNIFASLFYLEVQADSGSVRAVNAGHFPPLVLRGHQIEKMEKGGMALGLSTAATFSEQATALQKDDILLIYSDGLTEARNEQGDFFGERRLLDFLSHLSHLTAEELGNRLVAEVDRFTGEARANDDLSIALLKRV